MIGARATFCAAHMLPQHPEMHGHSYEVWAYTDTWDDAEEWQAFVQSVCKKLDHKTLSPGLAKMEQLAEWICEAVVAKRLIIMRPVEGLCAEFIVTE